MTAGAKRVVQSLCGGDIQTGEAESEAVGPDSDSGDAGLPVLVDPDLARVIAAWPTLPAEARAGIVAVVGAAKGVGPACRYFRGAIDAVASGNRRRQDTLRPGREANDRGGVIF